MDWFPRRFPPDAGWEREESGLWLPDGGRRGRLPWPSTTPVPALGRGARASSLIVVSDRFNRADNAISMGYAETAQQWVPVSGTWGISGGKAYCVTDTDADMVIINAGHSDGRCRVTTSGDIDGGVNTSEPHVILRYLDSANFLLLFLVAGNLYLYKRDNNSYSSLATAAAATANGVEYVISCLLIANSIKLYVDDVLKIAYTLSGGNTKFAAYTNYGMRLSRNGTPAVNARWDNFSVERLP